MGVMEDVAASVSSVGPPQAPSAALLPNLLESLLCPEGGGLSGLVRKFEQAELGPHVHSLIGKGRRLPITPSELTRALGRDEVARLATRTGLSTAHTSQFLAELLPQAINILTPGGAFLTVEALAEVTRLLREKAGA